MLFYYFYFKRNYDILKSKSPWFLLNKNITFKKTRRNRNLENPAHNFREVNLVLLLGKESQIKSKNVMSWSSRKKKECIFETLFFLTFVFYLNVQCIEYTFRICIFLQIKKHYFIHFCSLFLKSLKAFIVSLINLI